MKNDTNWFELMIENVSDSSNYGMRFLVVLLVLFIGAGSLYMLINSPA
jgi:hypothetical protein